MEKKIYMIPQVEALPIEATTGIMKTSNELPDDPGLVPAAHLTPVGDLL